MSKIRRSTSHSDNYDKYYKEEDGQSIYNSRFGKKEFTKREESILTSKIISKARQLKAQGLNKIVILDFGCGDGRLFPIFLQLASELEKLGMELVLDGYDISKTGLEVFKDKLEKLDFDIIESTDLQDNQYPRKIYQSSNKNLAVNLYCGSDKSSAGEIIETLADYDIAFCMFGSLSHIMQSQNRQSVLRILAMKSEDLVLTVPSLNIFKKHQQKEKFEDAEAGDIEYEVEHPDGKIINKYHLYDPDELRKDLELSGFKVHSLEADTLSNPIELTKEPINDYLNNLFCQTFGAHVLQHACYLMANCSSNKSFELEEIPRTSISPRAQNQIKQASSSSHSID